MLTKVAAAALICLFCFVAAPIGRPQEKPIRFEIGPLFTYFRVPIHFRSMLRTKLKLAGDSAGISVVMWRLTQSSKVRLFVPPISPPHTKEATFCSPSLGSRPVNAGRSSESSGSFVQDCQAIRESSGSSNLGRLDLPDGLILHSTWEELLNSTSRVESYYATISATRSFTTIPARSLFPGRGYPLPVK